MRRSDKNWAELDELLEPFLPDEVTENATAVELRQRVVKLEQQVMSQYTAMAAYATIAKQATDLARAECRADLDRSQATLIGLLEKLRSETNIRLDGLDRRTVSADLSGDAGSRLSRVEHELTAAMTALQACLEENAELRTQLGELVARRMREDGWLVATGDSQGLSLH